ncbi:hypothetical protein ACSBR2_033248 [Camellia fascicularis]
MCGILTYSDNFIVVSISPSSMSGTELIPCQSWSKGYLNKTPIYLPNPANQAVHSDLNSKACAPAILESIFQTSWIAEGCMNITNRDEFEGNVSKSALDDAVKACNQSLGNGSPCASCTTSLSSLQPSNLNGRSIGNLSDCTAYPSIYAAAFINGFCPTDKVRYTFDEIREATKNFSRLNIIRRGRYGNVYKGVLPDGSEVALKRFKNCSV